jgi:membrane-bound serine protease (ClpP class)
MVAAVKDWCRDWRGACNAVGQVSLGAVVLLLAMSAFPAEGAPDPAPVEAPPPADGLFITVRNPITTTVANRVITKVDRLLQRPDHRNLKIVFDFNPEGFPASTPDYGPCRTLAQFILDLHQVNTIAYVHNEVSGHTVLPVLACKEIVMSKGGKDVRDQGFTVEGKLGDVLRDQPRGLEPDQVVYYTQLAERTGRNPAVVLKMADKSIEIIEGTRKNAAWFIDRSKLAEETKKGFVPVVPQKVVVEAGRAGFYRAEQAYAFGLCSDYRETRQEVAEAYGLPPRTLREDLLEGRQPIAYRVIVRGPINGALSETLTRRIRRAIAAHNANFILLQLECHGGDPAEARRLADFLRTLKDDQGQEPVMTVAYVTPEAGDIAVLLALGCTEIVMDSKATLGNFETILRDRANFVDAVRDSVDSLAGEQGYPALVFRGMFEPKLEIHRVRSQKSVAERRLIDGDELKKDREGPHRWVDEGQIKAPEPAFRPGEWFRLGAEKAKELEIARAVVEGDPRAALPKIYAMYGVEKARDADLDWLDALAAFLREPWVGMLLIMVGITGLILELKIPGVMFPGILAAICFVLYFWANSQLAGHLTMLAVLLFVLGLILIGLEIFVVPGFGVTGVSGISLVVISLALATLVKKPETSSEWVDFGTTLSQIALSLLASIGAAFTLAWYLPNIPYVNRLVLKPPSHGDDADDASPLAAGEQLVALLGTVGEAATTLRPAGKARFGDEYLDVIAEGSYVEEGTRVQVIEVEGNRVVVKAV